MSALNDLLDEHLQCSGIVGYVREYQFAPPRRFRADFAWPDASQKLLVEVDGGVFSGGRHTTGTGYTADCVKLNLAALLGFRVLRFTTTMVKTGEALRTIEKVLGARG